MKERLFKKLFLGCYALGMALRFAGPLEAAAAETVSVENEALPKELQNAQITEKLGSTISTESLQFKDESGQLVRLSDYFSKGIPVVMALAYYNCPALCGVLLNGVTNSLRALDWTPGKEFEVVVVSINPQEGSQLATLKKENIIKSYGRIEAGAGLHFLTGEESQIKLLADQLGFGYYYDDQISEYAHSAGIFILTPEGRISRVLYGVDFAAKDLKLSLLEASEGKIGTTFERFLMFCYRYDPKRGGYSLQAMRLVQIGGLLTIVALCGYLFLFWRREKQKNSDRRMAA